MIQNYPKVPFHLPGISVFAPRQGVNEIVARDKGFIPENIPHHSDSPAFTLIRPVLNIALYNRSDMDGDPVTTFDPPIEVYVGYHLSDLEEGKCEFDQLKLAYWDGSRWTIISDPENEFNYQILPPTTAPVARFIVRSWPPDPMLAWGT